MQPSLLPRLGELSRRRTIIQEEGGPAAGDEPAEMPAANKAECLPGRVLRVHGLASVVQTDDGRQYRCAVRRLLRTLSTDERNIVTTGDRVWFRPAKAGEPLERAGNRKQLAQQAREAIARRLGLTSPHHSPIGDET